MRSKRIDCTTQYYCVHILYKEEWLLKRKIYVNKYMHIICYNYKLTGKCILVANIVCIYWDIAYTIY